MSEVEVLSHKRVYTGNVFAIDCDRVRMTNGREVTVDVVRHPKSVVLLPVPEPGHVSDHATIAARGNGACSLQKARRPHRQTGPP